MKYFFLNVLVIFVFLVSCVKTEKKASAEFENQKFQNKGHELIFKMVQKVGNYQKLLESKDVEYTYRYQTSDHKTDVSIERYLFDGELSYGAYHQHERTFPDLEGVIEQGYDGNKFWLKNQKKPIEEAKRMKRVTFNRKTNFYWFAMMQKLLDPGLNYTYIKQSIIEGKKYDIIKIAFDSKNKKPTDTYQVYINQETLLVDQFLFTIADFNIAEPRLMKVQYEKIDDFLIPTKRKYTKANWDGENIDNNWINVHWDNIKFNNGFSRKDFEQ